MTRVFNEELSPQRPGWLGTLWNLNIKIPIALIRGDQFGCDRAVYAPQQPDLPKQVYREGKWLASGLYQSQIQGYFHLYEDPQLLRDYR